MPRANKRNPRRTSDFQGLQRAQRKRVDKGASKSNKTRPVDLKHTSSSQDIAAVLRSLRERSR